MMLCMIWKFKARLNVVLMRVIVIPKGISNRPKGILHLDIYMVIYKYMNFPGRFLHATKAVLSTLPYNNWI